MPNPELSEVAAAATRLIASLQPGATPPGPSLTVIGTGIRAITQLTIEALAAMSTAEVLLHVIGEPLQEEALLSINPKARTMTGHYADGLERGATYEAMVQDVMAALAEGRRTVLAFYGHPGVFTYPSHESIRRARAAGFPARMLPAVSAEDCLVADLGIDPGDGCQAYEATSFLLQDHHIDPTAHLLLWQVGSIGNWTYESTGYDLSALPSLVARLLRYFPPTHPLTVYEASFEPGGLPSILRMPISRLDATHVTTASTVHIPPLRSF